MNTPTERIPLGPDGFPNPRYIHTLPCGKPSSWDTTGWRCHDCMAIYGSIACGCITTDEEEP